LAQQRQFSKTIWKLALLNESMNPCICPISNGPLNPPSLGDFEGLEVPQFGGFRGQIHTVIQQRIILFPIKSITWLSKIRLLKEHNQQNDAPRSR
jgi:hypothetical protein